MRHFIFGALLTICVLSTSFGESEQQPLTIQLIKVGNVMDVSSQEFLNNPVPVTDSLNSPDVTIEPCIICEAKVGVSTAFNLVVDNTKHTFVIKLAEVNSDTVTFEAKWIHQHEKETVEVNITEARTIKAKSYIAQSREPNSATILIGNWMTFAGYPLDKNERLLLRAVK